jgi:hypothetical protein
MHQASSNYCLHLDAPIDDSFGRRQQRCARNNGILCSVFEAETVVGVPKLGLPSSLPAARQIEELESKVMYPLYTTDHNPGHLGHDSVVASVAVFRLTDNSCVI